MVEKTKKDIKNDDFYKEILKHKSISESQFVLSLYKVSDWYHEYAIEPSDISDKSWRLYYIILQELLTTKQIKTIDMISMESYVDTKGEKLRAIYEANGGYETIEKGVNYIEEENIESYYNEIHRYNAVLELVELGYPIKENWSNYSKLTVEELSEVLEGQVASVFLKTEFGNDKVEDIFDDMEEMIAEADEGVNRGLPLNSKLLDGIQNGLALGNITMLAANSGVGKTFLTISQTVPISIEFNEPLMIIANEENKSKWQRELLTWHINNKQKGNFNKERFYQGGFNDEEKEYLTNATKWFRENVDRGLIRFVNLSDFSMAKSLKIIKKYANMKDVKYYIIDTLKLDNDANSKMTDNAWLQLQQNMVKLYNVIKPTNKNCHVWVTYQMSKSLKGKFLSQNDLGMSKNVADVVSSLLLVRLAGDNEKGEDKGSLEAKADDGRKVKLNPEKDYFIVFWDKNRQGATSEQAVIRIDRGRNIVKDIGRVRISQEYS